MQLSVVGSAARTTFSLSSRSHHVSSLILMRVFPITAAANRRFIFFLQHIINLVMSRQSLVSIPQTIKVAALSPATGATFMSFLVIKTLTIDGCANTADVFQTVFLPKKSKIDAHRCAHPSLSLGHAAFFAATCIHNHILNFKNILGVR